MILIIFTDMNPWITGWLQKIGNFNSHLSMEDITHADYAHTRKRFGKKI